MAYAKTLGIKYIIATIITFSIFGIFGNASLVRLFWISLLVIGIPYLGDLFLLPRIGNLLATIGDFGLYFLLYWGLSTLLIEVAMPIVIASLAAAFFSAISESILHIYIMEKVFDTKQNVRISNQQLQTEFAEETDAQTLRKEE